MGKNDIKVEPPSSVTGLVCKIEIPLIKAFEF
jgi:hypothetical protein